VRIEAVAPGNPVVCVAKLVELDVVALRPERLLCGTVVPEVLLDGPARHPDGHRVIPRRGREDAPDEPRDAAEAPEPGLMRVESSPEEAAGLEEQPAEDVRIQAVGVQEGERAEAGAGADGSAKRRQVAAQLR
jgi:hypothetical protein